MKRKKVRGGFLLKLVQEPTLKGRIGNETGEEKQGTRCMKAEKTRKLNPFRELKEFTIRYRRQILGVK